MRSALAESIFCPLLDEVGPLARKYQPLSIATPRTPLLQTKQPLARCSLEYRSASSSPCFDICNERGVDDAILITPFDRICFQRSRILTVNWDFVTVSAALVTITWTAM